MKKIAFFQKDLGVGGIQKSLINLLNNIDLNKYKVDLYLFSNDVFFNDKLPKNINIYHMKPKNFIFKFIPFNIAKFISNYKIHEEYDYAVDYNSYDYSCGVAACNTKAKHHVMWIHNDVLRERKNNFKYRILRFFFKGKYKYFDKFVGVSKGVIKPFQVLNKIDKKDFYVIPNYIDTLEIIKKSKDECDLNLDNKVYNLVSLGRLEHQKGFDLLILKMKKIIDVNPKFHLYIIGDGSKRNKLNKMISKLKLNDYITLIGAKKNPYKYLSKMDGFIIDSRYEGQGIVVLEAKTLGLDLFIPSKLSEYLEDISFSSDLVKDVLLAKKHPKKMDKLEIYNKKITNSIEHLFK